MIDYGPLLTRFQEAKNLYERECTCLSPKQRCQYCTTYDAARGTLLEELMKDDAVSVIATLEKLGKAQEAKADKTAIFDALGLHAEWIHRRRKEPPNAWNRFGLVQGKIPAGDPCPFERSCSAVNDRCPTRSHRLVNDFSCARARLASLVLVEGEQKVSEAPPAKTEAEKLSTSIVPIGISFRLNFDETIRWRHHLVFAARSYALSLDPESAKYVSVTKVLAATRTFLERTPLTGTTFARLEPVDPYQGEVFHAQTPLEIEFYNHSGSSVEVRGALLLETVR